RDPGRALARGRGGRRGGSGDDGARRGRRRTDPQSGESRRRVMISVEALLALVVLVALFFFISSFARILREYERAVIFRLGRTARAILNPGGSGNGPGLVLLVPIIDRMVKVSMQTVALDVPPQDVITR